MADKSLSTMDSPLQGWCYADLYEEVEDVLINSSPPMSLEPKALGLVHLDDDASGWRSNELDDYNDLPTWLHKMNNSVGDSSDVDQSNSVLIGCRDRWMPLPSPRPDDDLPLTAHSPVQKPTFELEEADFTLTESPSSMDSLFVLETNSASFYSWSQCAIPQELEENVSTQQFPRVESSGKSAVDQQNVELPMQQPPTVEVPEEPVVEQQIVENVEEPLHEVAQRVAVATEEKVYPKPVLSYPCLSALALKNCKTGQLRVTQIYSFMKLHFPHFENARPGWKNSVRHDLSNNESFKKIETRTGGCVNKRGSLWQIESAHATKIDEDLRTKTENHEQEIRKSMRHPESLDQLVNGELKSSFPGEEEQSEVTMRRGAKRRENGEGETQLSHVYPPAKRRNTDSTINATAEE